MDVAQWFDHAVSLVLGGAGGVAASIARLASLTSRLDKRITEVERRLDLLHAAAEERAGRIGELKEQLDGRFDDVTKDVDDIRRKQADSTSEVQRSLGSIEGTLNMIARNGCARACITSIPGHSRSSISDGAFPIVEPPTRGGGHKP